MKSPTADKSFRMSELCISIEKSQLNSNKGYLDLPTELTRVSRLSSESKSLWYSYDRKKYHPISLHKRPTTDDHDLSNETNEETSTLSKSLIVSQKQVMLQLSITPYTSENVRVEGIQTGFGAATPAGVGNIYWFCCIRPYVAGIYKCCIQSPNFPEITPINWTIIVHENSELSPESFVDALPKDTQRSPPTPVKASADVAKALSQLPTVNTKKLKQTSITDFAHKSSSSSQDNTKFVTSSGTKPPVDSSPDTAKSPRRRAVTGQHAELISVEISASKPPKIRRLADSDTTVDESSMSISASPTAAVSLDTTSNSSHPYAYILELESKMSEQTDEANPMTEVFPCPTADIVALVSKKVTRPHVSDLVFMDEPAATAAVSTGHASLKIVLPSSLVTALLDDKARVQGYIALPPSSSTAAATSLSANNRYKPYSDNPNAINQQVIRHNQKIVEGYERYNNPSVNDILCRIQTGLKKNLINDSHLAEMFKLIRTSFEFYFESVLLYDAERQRHVYGDKMDEIRKARKSSLSCHFGAIYLLRLLVFLAVGIDASVHVGSSDTPTDSTDRHTAAADGTDDSSKRNSAAGTSKSRREHLNSRQLLASAVKLQEAIGHIVKDLDTYSHFLFQ